MSLAEPAGPAGHTTTNSAKADAADEGQLVQLPSPTPHECVICMEEFDEANPEIRTLCKCGVNRAHWHLMCLMQWLEKENNCPICREPIYYEENHDTP